MVGADSKESALFLCSDTENTMMEVHTIIIANRIFVMGIIALCITVAIIAVLGVGFMTTKNRETSDENTVSGIEIESTPKAAIDAAQHAKAMMEMKGVLEVE